MGRATRNGVKNKVKECQKQRHELRQSAVLFVFFTAHRNGDPCAFGTSFSKSETAGMNVEPKVHDNEKGKARTVDIVDRLTL